MADNPKSRLFDCLSFLWLISRRAEDYWQHVALFEQEEALTYFSSLVKYPSQLGTLFGQISREELKKILNSLTIITSRPSSSKPSFFEISLWAALIDVKSTALRRDFVRISLEADLMSRRLLGAPSEVRDQDFDRYMELAKKYIALTKHIHPAFSHSEEPMGRASRRVYALG